jgi:hypothetical protein
MNERAKTYGLYPRSCVKTSEVLAEGLTNRVQLRGEAGQTF